MPVSEQAQTQSDCVVGFRDRFGVPSASHDLPPKVAPVCRRASERVIVRVIILLWLLWKLS